jgi:hypothetical protein
VAEIRPNLSLLLPLSAHPFLPLSLSISLHSQESAERDPFQDLLSHLLTPFQPHMRVRKRKLISLLLCQKKVGYTTLIVRI